LYAMCYSLNCVPLPRPLPVRMLNPNSNVTAFGDRAFRVVKLKLNEAINVNPFHYSCMENSMDRGAWQATVCGVTKRHN